MNSDPNDAKHGRMGRAAPVSLAHLRTQARDAEKRRQGMDSATVRAVAIAAVCCALGLALAYAWVGR